MKTIFFDVDSQLDFMFPSGALYVPGAETIVDRLAALNRHAMTNGIPLISTMDSHSEDDPEFSVYPHHCVVGTLGQRKVASTMVGQTISTKGNLDCFSNPALPELLDRLQAERYVVYGVVTEICIKIAAEGFLKRGGRVEVVTDAVRSLSEEAGAAWLAEFRANGGRLVKSAELL